MTRTRAHAVSSDGRTHAVLLAKDSTRLALIPVALAVIVTRLLGTRVFPTYDDAFITYRYARNLVEGHGFVYNVGEWVLGVTTPLFAVIPAVLELAGASVPTGMTVLNILCDVGVLALVGRMLASRQRDSVVLWFGLLWASSPILIRISVGGMESNLFVLASLWAIGLAMTANLGGALIVASCAVWLRPESLVLVAILLVLIVASARRSLPIAALLTSAVVLVAPAVAIHQLYGSVIPHSISAKLGFRSSVPVVVGQLVWPDPLALLMAPLAIWGCVRIWKGDRERILIPAWGVAYCAAYLLRRPGVWSWYAAPVQLVVLFAAAYGCADIFDRVTRYHRVRASIALASTGSLLIVAVWASIAATRPEAMLYRDMQEWVAESDVSKSTILALDIGAIGYYSHARVLDAAGLVGKEREQYRTVKEMIIDKQPDYVMINAIRGHVHMMADPALIAQYGLVLSLPRARQDTINLNPGDYPQDWRQEYLIFKRRSG